MSMALSVDTTTPKGKDANGNDTPGARMRAKKNVNSPRGKGTSSGVPANIMTQVDRPAGGPDKQRMSKEDSELADTQREIAKDLFCGGCCYWICGGGSRYQDESLQSGRDVPMAPIPAYPAERGLMDENEPEATPSSSASEGLLGKPDPTKGRRKCLVLDLDETLVHSSFKPVNDADFIVPVEIDGLIYKVYVLKRPWVDEFLVEVAKHYEVVVFTASLSLYANPLLDMLDVNEVIEHRLFREACVLHGQAYVKDLSLLGRKMKDTIIVDNSPLSYAFQPTSAVPITSWFDDRKDNQLKELIPVLCTKLKHAPDVRSVLDANNKSFMWLCEQGDPYDMKNFKKK